MDATDQNTGTQQAPEVVNINGPQITNKPGSKSGTILFGIVFVGFILVVVVSLVGGIKPAPPNLSNLPQCNDVQVTSSLALGQSSYHTKTQYCSWSGGNLSMAISDANASYVSYSFIAYNDTNNKAQFFGVTPDQGYPACSTVNITSQYFPKDIYVVKIDPIGIYSSGTCNFPMYPTVKMIAG